MAKRDEGGDRREHEVGAGVARTPSASRAAQSEHMREDESESISTDTASKSEGHHGEGASMGRSPSATRTATKREQAEQRHEFSGNAGAREVSGGGATPSGHKVDSEHVMGQHDEVHAHGAEGFSDEASARANRHEADEPERERDEQRAVRSGEVRHEHTFGSGHGAGGREVAAKNVIGHGQRETKACNTI